MFEIHDGLVSWGFLSMIVNTVFQLLLLTDYNPNKHKLQSLGPSVKKKFIKTIKTFICKKISI